MRVTILSNLYPPDVLGGYELLAHDVCRKLRARGHEVTVLTTGEGGAAAGLCRSLRLARPFSQAAGRDRLRHVWAGAQNKRATERYLADYGEPDGVLVMSLRRLGLEPLRAFERRGIPVVYTVNDDWPASYAGTSGPGLRGAVGALLDRLPLVPHAFRGLKPERVVYLSEAIRSLVRATGVPLPPGVVQAQGVDTDQFTSRPFRRMSEEPRLLFVGRLHPSKAPDLAIETLAALRARGVRARLQLAGAPVTPAYGRELAALAERLGVTPHLEMLGQIERQDLPGVYGAADAALFLNRWTSEGQGLTYMEAMACGTPVVAYPLGGARELLDLHPVTMRATRPDGQALADAVVALQKDEAEQRRLYHEGLHFVREQASLDAYVSALEVELLQARTHRGQAAPGGLRPVG